MPLLISRQAGVGPAIPLDHLQLEDPRLEQYPWTFWDEVPQMLEPDMELTLTLETDGEEAAIVIYTVNGLDGTEYMVFISEALIQSGPSPTEESTWGGIKGLYR